MSPQPEPQILPWTSTELEGLLLDLVAHGTETSKVDFKVEVEANTPEQKSELLKDICAIANTYDENYRDHGFLVYGVKAKAIVGITLTQTDTDKFQNHIEQLLKSYISPMPLIYVVGFETAAGQKWGAIVIPPRNNKPHMFFKEFQCQNPKYTRKRGEWFVRRGSTTDPGLPEDLTIIAQKQTELLVEPLRESIRSLQARVSKMEEQYNSALFKLVERALASSPQGEEQDGLQRYVPSSEIGYALGLDLPARIKQRLRTPRDALVDELIGAARELRNFLNGSATGIPWAPQLQNADANKRVIEVIEEKTRPLQISIATIMLSGEQGAYTNALLRSIRILARTPEAPSGTPYNRIGETIRFYPLGLLLYTIFVCGVATGNSNVMKLVLDVPLKHHRSNVVVPITEVFFYWSEARVLFNNAFNQRLCEPISQRVRQSLGDHVVEMIADLTEPEFFFRGEFVLALTHIDAGIASGEKPEHQVPLPGQYLYMNDAQDVIADFLREDPDWFRKFYAKPLNDILAAFDRNASKMVAPGCIGTGLHGLSTLDLYEASRKERKIIRQ